MRRPPTGGIVNVSVFRRSPSTVTSAWNSSPGDMPSNSTRPVSSVFRARLRKSPPAFLMMALTSVSATAFAGSLRPTRTLTVPVGIPRSGSGRPTIWDRSGIPPPPPPPIMGCALAAGAASSSRRDDEGAS